ncbi:MAG: pyruvate dehydrogenase complex dihydrolipoamide acetyltransferase [Acidobacteria bacterium]|jgi:pyruvate dehydrogenase E2 component (dihydrolipoamide acetyltransferase)|nr:MAG: pyruvate dehydrogenase complex dihydrolipoamide acetyltransferase [Acidobacteriota bacterium]GIU82249.1 MAG: acetyltransferase component of pyruvate dehydrogenase complex [Pyrinomonadaceae bacterium]
MASKILMPKLSPTMEEGQISRWLKKEGDEVQANETIAEVDTDKATMEMTALESGVLLKILVPEGGTAKLGQVIGIIGQKGEDISQLLADTVETATSPETSVSAADSSKDGEKAKVKEAEKTESVAVKSGNGFETAVAEKEAEETDRIFVSPIAARMAAEHGIDLRSIKGSGPGGRIIKRDIEAALARVATLEVAQPVPTEVPVSLPFTPQREALYREETTTQMRRTIAKRLVQSIGPIPTFYLTIEIEMDKAIEFRQQINSTVGEDEKVSLNDIIVKTAAMALMKHPFVNSSYRDDKIRFYEDADIGVAVAIEDGLITPVVRQANKKGILQISREIKELAARAREKKLQPEEYTGATFSISNLGMYGIKQFTAIINPPEAAILAVGSATPTPVVRDGSVTVRNIMHVTMSCDHRVIDGATGARFLQTFKQMLENPILMVV